MYHRQALEFIAQSRGAPLSCETLSIFSSYLPLNYVSSSTKIAILANLIDRVDVEGGGELQTVMESPAWTQIPELVKSGNSEIRNLASHLAVLGAAKNANQPNQLTRMPSPAPTLQHPPRPPRIRRNNPSRAIDGSLGGFETGLRREKEIRDLKIIVIGPRHCGKTTLLKGIRSSFAPKAFHAEIEAWRPVIRLNLVRTMNFVISILLSPNDPLNGENLPMSTPSTELKQLATNIASRLREVEETLFKCIAPPEKISQAGWYPRSRVAEFSSENVLIPFRREHMREEEGYASQLLTACANNMQELWTSNETQQLLAQHSIELTHQPGFFLDDLQRICDENYIPTTKDILRTRVHNCCPHGLEKHKITEERSVLTAYEMKGAFETTERAKWAKFVDNVTCLIFVIPISAFDEVYEENRIKVNRLEQSFKQWRAICSNKLLASVGLTVCVTKMDILRHKIESGKQFARYIKSYGDLPNNADTILAYVSQKLESIRRKSCPNPNYITSATFGLRSDAMAEIIG
ncbi:putative G protein alpha chain [Favolaschia claudopus]|uniref:G protein alpha chain n=1 Tax=Favolaschia claudopus TaxID=2862362 RepID=A0AAW0BTU9_9AGAR